MAKVTVENLAKVIDDLLEEYAEDCTKTTGELAKEVAKKGVQALKSASKATFNGNEYWKGWAVDTDSQRYGTTCRIWNKKYPGLPHLLEYSHALRQGGRTTGRPHIEPVEQELIKSFEEGLMVRLQK